jgi:hypothetical protein
VQAELGQDIEFRRSGGLQAIRTAEEYEWGRGAWSGPLGAMLDLDIPIVAVRGQMWATAPVGPRSFHTIAAAESAMAWARDHGAPPDLTIRDGQRVTRHLYGRQRRNGEMIFGGDRDPADRVRERRRS